MHSVFLLGIREVNSKHVFALDYAYYSLTLPNRHKRIHNSPFYVSLSCLNLVRSERWG